MGSPKTGTLDRIWISFRDCHTVNKVLSIAISLFMCYWMLEYKHEAYKYYHEAQEAGVKPRQANIYSIMIWLSFVYFAFQALAEFLEIYSSVLGRDRGALGLLFEINQIVGIVVACYCLWWYYSEKYIIHEGFREKYEHLEMFVNIQVIMIWVALGFSFVSFIMFWLM